MPTISFDQLEIIQSALDNDPTENSKAALSIIDTLILSKDKEKNYKDAVSCLRLVRRLVKELHDSPKSLQSNLNDGLEEMDRILENDAKFRLVGV